MLTVAVLGPSFVNLILVLCLTRWSRYTRVAYAQTLQVAKLPYIRAAEIGGAGTLLGPLVGTTLFIVVREVVSTHWEHHALIVGVVAILVVIFAPRGVVGLWNDWITRLCARRGDVQQSGWALSRNGQVRSGYSGQPTLHRTLGEGGRARRRVPAPPSNGQ